MPRAHEYRDGAALLRHRSSAFAAAATAYRNQRIDDVATGPIADAHDESMARLAGHLTAGSERLSELARVCDDRAAVCEAYAAKVRDWEQTPVWSRILTPRPDPPAPWADA